MSSKELIKLLHEKGWRKVSQNGYLLTFKHPDNPFLITLTHPVKDVKKGILHSCLKIANKK